MILLETTQAETGKMIDYSMSSTAETKGTPLSMNKSYWEEDHLGETLMLVTETKPKKISHR